MLDHEIFVPRKLPAIRYADDVSYPGSVVLRGYAKIILLGGQILEGFQLSGWIQGELQSTHSELMDSRKVVAIPLYCMLSVTYHYPAESALSQKHRVENNLLDAVARYNYLNEGRYQ